MTAETPKVSLRIRLWVWAGVILPQIQAATQADFKVTLVATKKFVLYSVLSLAGMVAGHNVGDTHPVMGKTLMIALGAVIAWQCVALLKAEIPVLWHIVRFLLRQTWRTVKIIAPPVGVLIAWTLVFTLPVAAFAFALGRLAFHKFFLLYLGEALVLGWKAWKAPKSTWIRFTWQKFALPKASFAVCLHQGVLMVVAFLLFTQYGARDINCAPQLGLHHIITTCEARTEAKAFDPYTKGDWWTLWFKIRGVVGTFNLDARHLWESTQDGVVYAGFSWNQKDRLPTVLMKYNVETGEIVKVFTGYTPFDGACFKALAKCVVTSPTERSLMFIDDNTNEVVDGLDFGQFSPSFVAKRDEETVALVLVPLEGAAEFNKENSLTKGVTLRPIPQIECKRHGCRVGVVVNVRTGELVSWRIWENPPPALMAAEMYYTTYIPELDAVQFGVVPAMMGLQEGGPLKVARMSVPGAIWGMYFSDGSAYDPRSGITYVAFPSDGIGVLDTELQEVERITSVPMGIRPITIDTSRNILFVGTYDGGELFAKDMSTWETLATWHVGGRFRQARYNAKLDRLELASGYGFMYLDLAEAFPSATVVASAAPP